MYNGHIRHKYRQTGYLNNKLHYIPSEYLRFRDCRHSSGSDYSNLIGPVLNQIYQSMPDFDSDVHNINKPGRLFVQGINCPCNLHTESICSPPGLVHSYLLLQDDYGCNLQLMHSWHIHPLNRQAGHYDDGLFDLPS